jgi:hypothetical protein
VRSGETLLREEDTANQFKLSQGLVSSSMADISTLKKINAKPFE